MDLPQIETELGNAMAGSAMHPYMNERDLRHPAAIDYVSALYARRHALQTATQADPGRDAIDQAKAARLEEAKSWQAQMRAAGYSDFELPPEPDQIHLDAMRRDVWIRTGRLDEALMEINGGLHTEGLFSSPVVQSTLRALDAIRDQPCWRDDPGLTALVESGVLALHHVLLERLNEKWLSGRKAVARARGSAV